MDKVIELIKEIISDVRLIANTNTNEIKELWGEVESLKRKNDQQDAKIDVLISEMRGLTKWIQYCIMAIIGAIISYCVPVLLDILKG